MPAPSLFDFLKALNEPGGNPNMLEEEDALKAYAPFMINRGVAQSQSTVMLAAECNRVGMVDKNMHFSFLFHAIKKTKRFNKWAKKNDVPEEIGLIQKVYNISFEKAMEYAKLLSPEQIAALVEYSDEGGQQGRASKGAKK